MVSPRGEWISPLTTELQPGPGGIQWFAMLVLFCLAILTCTSDVLDYLDLVTQISSCLEIYEGLYSVFFTFQEKDFVGKSALEMTPEDGSNETLVLLEVTPSGDEWLWGHEPVYTDGHFSGFTSSSLYDFDTNTLLCWAVLRDRVKSDTTITLEAGDTMYPACVKNSRLTSKYVGIV